MGWFRLDESWPRNLKIKRAGRDASLLYLALLALHQTYGTAGLIPANKADPEALELEIRALGMTAEKITLHLNRLETVGLVRLEGEVDTPGGITILGMEDAAFSNTCSSCHGPNDNPRRRTCQKCLDKKKAKRRPEESPQTSAASAGDPPDPPPEPEPEPDQPQQGTRPEPEPSAGGSWISEGIRVLASAGVEMKPSLCAQLLAQFETDGGGLWDLRRLVALGNPPGVLVNALKVPGRWSAMLLDCTDDPDSQDGPHADAVDELTRDDQGKLDSDGPAREAGEA